MFESSLRSVMRATYLRNRKVVLSLAGALFFRKRLLFSPDRIGKVLFIRIDRIGDMVLSTPALNAIKAALPLAHLAVLASPATAPILKNNPAVDEVIVFDPTSPLPNKIGLLRSLRGRHFDLAVDPYDDYELKTACLAWISGTTHRIGYAAFGREVFFNGPILKSEGNRHFVDIALDLLKAVGIPTDNVHPAIYLDQNEQLWATQWLKEKGLGDRKLVAIHPGAYYETQRWPPRHYAELIDLIRARTQAEVILFGGPADAPIIEEIARRVANPVCVSSERDIRTFLALVAQCCVLVCNNSGPLHCAVALGIPTVSFMGPTAKERWAPVGERHHVFRRDDLFCIGCNLGTCLVKTHDCMESIKPETVLPILEEIING